MASDPHTGNCKEVFALLSQWLDKELPPDAWQEIQAHLAGCPPCIEFAESLRKTVALCHEYDPGEVPGPIGEKAKAEMAAAWARFARRGVGDGG